MTRTPLRERVLPNYTRKEEHANMLTHAFGAAVGAVVLVLAAAAGLSAADPLKTAVGCLYALSMICLFSVSAVYHGLKAGYAKKLMQVIDHCTIYFLIAGTYSPILLCAIRPLYPKAAWMLFVLEWALALFASVFTAIDHNRYSKLSMSCYIGMGWLVLLAVKPAYQTLGPAGFLWLLGGGVAYTLGAVLYGVGKKKPIYHTVFHVFVDIGAIMHAVCILKYVL